MERINTTLWCLVCASNMNILLLCQRQLAKRPQIRHVKLFSPIVFVSKYYSRSLIECSGRHNRLSNFLGEKQDSTCIRQSFQRSRPVYSATVWRGCTRNCICCCKAEPRRQTTTQTTPSTWTFS